MKRTKATERARFRARYHANKERERNRRFQKLYGITVAQRDEIIRQQDGKCAICADLLALQRGTNGANVDHDHRTGRMRGILCAPCNRSLGQFKDSVHILASALKYLEYHNSLNKL